MERIKKPEKKNGKWGTLPCKRNNEIDVWNKCCDEWKKYCEQDDEIFAKLLNMLSVGFFLFFLSTILICWLAFRCKI